MSSPARMAADLAAAFAIAHDADYAVVQDPILVKCGDSLVMDPERVGVFPGPRSCADTKNLSVLIAVVQPLVDAHDSEPKPIFLDMWSTARDAGGSGAEILKRAKIALIHATLEYLFQRVNHGDIRVLPDAVFLPSVYSSAPPAAQPVVAPAPAPAAGAPASTTAPAAAATSAAATTAAVTPGSVVSLRSRPEDEEGVRKRACTDEAEGAAGSSVAGELPKRMAAGDSAGGDRPLFKVSVQAQWSSRFARIMEYVPDLGRAMHIGLEGCAALITQMSAELHELDKLAGQDVNMFKKEREFTAMLMAMIDHSFGAGPDGRMHGSLPRVGGFFGKK